LFSTDPNNPIFQAIDSADGIGADYTELRARATFRITIPLPPGVHLTSDPNATTITVRRGAPSTFNTPALDPTLMWDGREPSLASQARDAILGHAQGTLTPTANQLQLITQFEQGLFSNDTLEQYAQGGPAPTWPPGSTDSEQRGRRWFAPDPAAPKFNVCGQCHGGPMANETQSNADVPAGEHFQTVNVSEFNHANNPTYEFSFPDPEHPGQTVTIVTPDPGRALITGDFRDVNFFKIPTLWGIKNTAPYFHDNSVNTLEDLMDHYEQDLNRTLPTNATYPDPHVPTAQDKADIVAYLKLL
jgi:cytochrome c peroxidase